MHTKQLENPFPHLAEATDAAGKIFKLQKDLLQATAELKAQEAVEKAVFLAGGMVLINAMLVLSLYWVTSALYEAGWSPWTLAIICFVVLTPLSALCFRKVGLSR